MYNRALGSKGVIMAIDYKKVYEQEDAPQVWRKFYEYKKLYSPDELLNNFKYIKSFKGFILPNGDILPMDTKEYHWDLGSELLQRYDINEDELRQQNKARFPFKEDMGMIEELYFENNGAENWLVNSQGLIRVSAGYDAMCPKLPCKYYYGKDVTWEQEEVLNKLINYGLLKEDEYKKALYIVRDLERIFEGIRLRIEIEEAQEK